MRAMATSISSAVARRGPMAFMDVVLLLVPDSERVLVAHLACGAPPGRCSRACSADRRGAEHVGGAHAVLRGNERVGQRDELLLNQSRTLELRTGREGHHHVA